MNNSLKISLKKILQNSDEDFKMTEFQFWNSKSFLIWKPWKIPSSSGTNKKKLGSNVREIGNRFLEIDTSSKIELNLFVLFKRYTWNWQQGDNIYRQFIRFRPFSIIESNIIEEKLYTCDKVIRIHEWNLLFLISNKKYRCSGFLMRGEEGNVSIRLLDKCYWYRIPPNSSEERNLNGSPRERSSIFLN